MISTNRSRLECDESLQLPLSWAGEKKSEPRHTKKTLRKWLLGMATQLKQSEVLATRDEAVHLIAHRGFWTKPEDKNSMRAFRAALENGYGIETDVRDLKGELVISHDMPKGCEDTLEAFLELYCEIGNRTTLAINIKSDGLAEPVKQLLDQYAVENYFCFDMSIPDMMGYFRNGATVFARRSEYEPTSIATEKANGIWLDAFEGHWFDSQEWDSWLRCGKDVCVVSPELHKRDRVDLWRQIHTYCQDESGESSTSRRGRLMLCTDFPHEFWG